MAWLLYMSWHVPRNLTLPRNCTMISVLPMVKSAVYWLCLNMMWMLCSHFRPSIFLTTNCQLVCKLFHFSAREGGVFNSWFWLLCEVAGIWKIQVAGVWKIRTASVSKPQATFVRKTTVLVCPGDPTQGLSVKPCLFTDKLCIPRQPISVISRLSVKPCLSTDKYSIVSKRLNTEAVFTIKLSASCVQSHNLWFWTFLHGQLKPAIFMSIFKVTNCDHKRSSIALRFVIHLRGLPLHETSPSMHKTIKRENLGWAIHP